MERLVGDFYLPIGVLVGYHVVESKEDQVSVPRYQTDESNEDTNHGESSDQHNTGFGVVIPIDAVMEMIKSIGERLVAFADSQEKKR